jgi:CPA2 family monovalent cation:H+ antiporter-2
LSLALSSGLLQTEEVQILIAAILLSMLLTPALIHHNGRLARWLCGGSYNHERQGMIENLADVARDLREHTIICGYGRVGQNIARFLEQENFSYLALDLDPLRVREAREAGEQVNYGDAANHKILEAAGLARARALVVSFEDFYATLKVLAQVRHLRPDIPVLVRTADDANLERLQQAGATEVIPETLEASLMLSSHLLLLLGVSVRQVLHTIENVRNHRYQMLRGFFHGQDDELRQESEAYRERLHTFILSPDSHAVGHTLRDYRLEDVGATVTAVRRHGVRGEAPDPDMQLQSGDTLILSGVPEALWQAEQRLASGWRGMAG